MLEYMMIAIILAGQAAPMRGSEKKIKEAPVPTMYTEKVVEKPDREWTAIEVVLSVAILLFGLCVLCMETFLVLKTAGTKTWDATSISRITGLTLIITSGLTLVTAGYSSEQMSPVMGLLGTIAGYLLGSGKRE
jgi:hypothetical protein